MSVRACTCPLCHKTTTPELKPHPAHEPVQLPSEPRDFRIHSPGRRPQDCTLHPDGTITSVMAGQLWRCGQTFDEMRQMGWRDSHIEWDPAPPHDTGQQRDDDEGVQEAIAL
ncbi:hypothetical protein [Streptomyces javensis]|uniref:Uncharacterized protein n=1 Tax=Streptomyces javensis TaxID=114698 RepID=A0ABS0RPB0_9ACTN|nr:hypothetical protein [Streptomyces javensis]MBI0319301.1 hypothetical protein [Streptomyces javensis]